MNTLVELTDPNGATIRLTAATTSAWRLPGPVTVDGQVGPPTASQLGSADPSQRASTVASRAPSRAACETTLLR